MPRLKVWFFLFLIFQTADFYFAACKNWYRANEWRYPEIFKCSFYKKSCPSRLKGNKEMMLLYKLKIHFLILLCLFSENKFFDLKWRLSGSRSKKWYCAANTGWENLHCSGSFLFQTHFKSWPGRETLEIVKSIHHTELKTPYKFFYFNILWICSKSSATQDDLIILFYLETCKHDTNNT